MTKKTFRDFLKKISQTWWHQRTYGFHEMDDVNLICFLMVAMRFLSDLHQTMSMNQRKELGLRKNTLTSSDG